MDLKAIAKRMDQAAKKYGKSNDIIAGKCGLKAGESVRLWREGKTAPLLKHIQAFANAVEMSADWILVGYSKDDVVNSMELPAKNVDMSKRIAALRPEIREPLEAMVNELTSDLNIEDEPKKYDTAQPVHDAEGEERRPS